MSNDIKPKIKKIVADHLGIERRKLLKKQVLLMIWSDSLDTVELVMAFEEEFGSEISDSEAEKILTVGMLSNLLKANLINNLNIYKLI